MREGLGEIMGSIGIQHVRAHIKTRRVFVDFMLIQETSNHQQTKNRLVYHVFALNLLSVKLICVCVRLGRA